MFFTLYKIIYGTNLTETTVYAYPLLFKICFMADIAKFILFLPIFSFISFNVMYLLVFISFCIANKISFVHLLGLP